MIGRLRGVLAERTDDGAIVVDVGGVGYEVHVPLGALGHLPAPPEPATLHVHTHAREDALILYGFPTQADRDAFRTLLGVSSIGPKIALSILSVLDAERLAVAVTRGDKAAFKGIPGVGKKTVERLMIDLKDKLQAVAAGAKARPAAARAAPVPTGPLATVAAALVQMGYKESEADRAVAHLEAKAEGKPIETLLREALAILA
ncbi:MAG: Holliday junction branch migration protein RuvA [Myxococcota bacterium]